MKIVSFFFAAVYYIYILYSIKADRYYIGHTNDPVRRLEEHNTAEKNSYSSKFRPWELKKVFEVSESRGETRKLENYMKRLKSRKEIEKLLEDESLFERILQLVRAIPTRRD